MRHTMHTQPTFDCPLPDQVTLNLQCRDEIIPILAALQHLYKEKAALQPILHLVEKDVNQASDRHLGRPGLSYWEILVLAAIRLGCNYDYDKLQDVAENHRRLRLIMGVGTWEELVDEKRRTRFDWSRLRDNLCLLSPDTLAQINEIIVKVGHQLQPAAVNKIRVDTFVTDTNIHYPTDSSLIGDGLRKIIPLAAKLARQHGISGWRQHKKLVQTAQQRARKISKESRTKKKKKERVKRGYQKLLSTAHLVLNRVTLLVTTLATTLGMSVEKCQQTTAVKELMHYVSLTEQVCQQAHRRVILGEKVPNAEKILSIFEPHTELVKRDKQSQPLQFGRRVLVGEDGAGFVVHYAVVPQGVQDAELTIPVVKTLQEKYAGKVETVSFDRGFHSPTNQEELAKLVKNPCLAAKGKAGAEQEKTGTIEFKKARKRHPGVESAIGALQAGNGLERCRDRSELGFHRYVGLGILGRNLHLLGKIIITQTDKRATAAKSKRREAS